MAFALAPQLPAHVDPPAIVRPASREISFGRISGKVGAGTYRVVVRVDDREEADERVRGTEFDLHVDLPLHDVTVEVEAQDALGNSASAKVPLVLGISAADETVASRSSKDRALSRTVADLVETFPGTSAVYVENLETGTGAAWNATARFPAASTVKLAIAVEVLRTLSDRPDQGTELDILLRDMLVASDNDAANALLAWLGGTETGGAARVNALLESLDLGDTHLYGGFLIRSPAPIPLTTESQPAFEGKYTTAWDLARLFKLVHLAATGEGALLDLEGSFAPSDARAILWLLGHSDDHGKLDRFFGIGTVVAHKAGWITDARHDAGIVYTPDGAFVAAVMTFLPGAAGDSSDLLAGEVARAAKERLGEAVGAGPSSASAS